MNSVTAYQESKKWWCHIRLTVVLVLITSFSLVAQFDSTYSPLAIYHGKKANSLIQEINFLYKEVLRDPEIRRSGRATDEYIKIRKSFALQIKNGWFIDHDTLETALLQIMYKLYDSNQLTKKPIHVLVSKSPLSNALCMGQGTFTFTVRLLSSLNSESEVAFVLGHELAHHEMDHVKQKSLMIADKKNARVLERESKKLASGKSTAGGLNEMQEVLYRSA